MHSLRILILACGLFWAALVCLSSGSAQQQAATAQSQGLFEKRCGGCHALDREKEGPRLAGVYGRTAGSLTSFQYSDALKSSKLTWNAETLDRWLIDPGKEVPGTDMTFHVDKADDRRDIIIYLKSISGK